MLVAPVTIGDGAYTAAGSVIDQDVPPGAIGGRPGAAAQHRGLGRAQAPGVRGGHAASRARHEARTADVGPRRHGTSGQDEPTTEHEGQERVTGIKNATEKNLMLFSGRAHPELADEVAEHLGVDLVPTAAYDFANGEIFVRFEESVRGSDAFVIQATPPDINKWIMEQLIMVDALKRASAKRITVVLPFYGYARQDKKHRGREPISARLIADLFKAAGRRPADDRRPAHRQIQGFFDGPVDHLFALPLLAQLHRPRRRPVDD